MTRATWGAHVGNPMQSVSSPARHLDQCDTKKESEMNTRKHRIAMVVECVVPRSMTAKEARREIRHIIKTTNAAECGDITVVAVRSIKALNREPT